MGNQSSLIVTIPCIKCTKPISSFVWNSNKLCTYCKPYVCKKCYKSITNYEWTMYDTMCVFCKTNPNTYNYAILK